jgi:dienelactone hydrolase
MSERNVGPLAGAIPDPVYGNTQQRFNVYRPADLTQGHCHPIILWGNGHTDNPEPNPPLCLAQNFCGDYRTIVNQLASHGFVVIASLSTIVSQRDPGTGLLPQIVGMNWLVQQNEDPTSAYYHHLDISRIGATGHSEGGFATSVVGADPHVLAIATMAGATAMPMLHGPALFLCGGMDTLVPCTGIQRAFDFVTATPVMLEENPRASHGSWIGSIMDPYQVAVTAWMRVHLMNDTALRSMFYGQSCTLCQDMSVSVQRKNMDQ